VKLRQHVRAARKLGRLRYRRAMRACRHSKRTARLQARALREQRRLEVAREIASARTQARQQCDATKDRARSMRASSVARAIAALDAERSHQAFMLRGERASRPKLDKAARRTRRSDQKAESDSEVENSIEAELLPVWRVVKKRISATTRATRLENFLEWVEEHGTEVRRILDAEIERDVRHLIEHENELRARVEDPSSYARMTDAELDAVPF
jgi:hypothetical protein